MSQESDRKGRTESRIDSNLEERGASVPPAETAGKEDGVAVDWDFIRSMLGLLFLLLGVVGIVVQITLSECGILPKASWLWVASFIIGVLGLASVSCDFARAFVRQAMSGTASDGGDGTST